LAAVSDLIVFGLPQKQVIRTELSAQLSQLLVIVGKQSELEIKLGSVDLV
jgi:hypothetical protein